MQAVSKEDGYADNQQYINEQESMVQENQNFDRKQQQEHSLEQHQGTEALGKEQSKSDQEPNGDISTTRSKDKSKQEGDQENTTNDKGELKGETENMDVAGESKADEDEGEKSNVKKLHTLADMITVCRSKGIQIYSDISNRPEADKRVYTDDALAGMDQLGPSRGKKRHRHDNRSSKRNESQNTSTSRNTDDDDLASTSGYGVPRDRLNTGTSYGTSYRTGTTRLDSRLSGRSKNDRRYVAADFDAEEILQQRMREKSKRRRERKMSLLDVVKQKETEVGSIAIKEHLQKKMDKSNMVNTNSKRNFQPDELRTILDNSNVSVNGMERSENSSDSRDNADDNLRNNQEHSKSGANDSFEIRGEYTHVIGEEDAGLDTEGKNDTDDQHSTINPVSIGHDKKKSDTECDNDNVGCQKRDMCENVCDQDGNSDNNTNKCRESDENSAEDSCDKKVSVLGQECETINARNGIDQDSRASTCSNKCTQHAVCDDDTENVIARSENNNEMLNHDLIEKGAKSGETIPGTDNKINDKKGIYEERPHGDANENDRPQGDATKNAEIEEYIIREGDTTLVLYKLKTDYISDPVVRDQVLHGSRPIDNANGTSVENHSLKSNARGRTSGNKQLSEPVDRVNSRKYVFKTGTPKAKTCTTGKHSIKRVKEVKQTGSNESKRGRGTIVKTCIGSSESNRDTELTEHSMDVERRQKFANGVQGRENVKSNDSGIGSDSEKESLSKAEQNVITGKGKKDRSKNVTTVRKEDETKIKHQNQTERATLKISDAKSYSGANTERHHGGSNGDHKKVSKPARSLGNGFLVSSDDPDSGNVNGNKENKGLPTKPNNMKEMSKETRMIFLMEKIRQRYEEEKQSQMGYLVKIGETRRELRDVERDLRGQVDMSKDYKMPPPLADIPPKNEYVEEKHVVVRKSPAKPEPEPEPEEITYPVKKKITARIDCKWHPDHPLYPQIKSGFKSTVKIPNTNGVQFALRSMTYRRNSRSTPNLDSLYLKEATRLRPKLFSKDDLDSKDKNALSKSRGISSNHSIGDRYIKHSNERTGKREEFRSRTPDRYDEDIGRQNHRSKLLKDKTGKSNRTKTNLRDAENDKSVAASHTQANDYSRTVPKPKPAKLDHDERLLRRERENMTLYERLTERAAALSQASTHSKTHGSGDIEQNSGVPTNTSYKKEQLEDIISRKRAKNHVSGQGSIVTNGSVGSVRSTTPQTPSGELPMSLAVNIVQSRNKFYSSDRKDGEDTPRENRIYKLYRDLQHIRQSGDTDISINESSDGHVTDTDIPETSPQLLFLNYEDLHAPDCQQKSNKDLNDFLYGNQNYEMCSKGRSLYVSADKKDKALNVLRQRINNKITPGGTKVR